MFDKIDTLLAKAATDKGNLLSAQIWLADMADYDGMNQVWDAWLAGVGAPVRVCVESPMDRKHYRIEVQVIAALIE